MPDEAAYVEVQVDRVGRTQADRWTVRLRDANARELDIVIGQCEAMAIAQRQVAGFEPKRPLTQDLALALWRRLGGELIQLRIDDLWEGIYYSKLTVNQRGEQVDIDCRPSDGIALALTGKAPIYVADSVMRRGAGEESEAEPGTLDEMLRDLTAQSDDDLDDELAEQFRQLEEELGDDDAKDEATDDEDEDDS
jgi:bifunctional DNase/RNase